MQHHYLTVNGGEQRDALAKVVPLPAAARRRPAAGGSGEGAPSEGEGTKETG